MKPLPPRDPVDLDDLDQEWLRARRRPRPRLLSDAERRPPSLDVDVDALDREWLRRHDPDNLLGR